MPQNPGAGSVNRNSTYPTALPSVLDFTTTQTTSFLVFSLVRKTSCPGASSAEMRSTAPCPKTSTVCERSEKGSRLSEPSTDREPFTVTGTSSATGCGRAGALPAGAAGIPGAVGAAAFSGSFTMGVINHSLKLDLYGQARTAGFPVLPLYGGFAGEGAI